MDTNVAIQTLKAISLDLESKIAGLTAQKQSVDVAVSQLDGTLITQMAERDAAIAASQASLKEADNAKDALQERDKDIQTYRDKLAELGADPDQVLAPE